MEILIFTIFTIFIWKNNELTICCVFFKISLATSVTQHNNQLYVSIYDDRYPFIEIDNQTNIVINVAEADFADFSKSLKPKKSMHDTNFQWYCTAPAYGQMNFTPPSYNERFPEKHNANAHLIFGCGNNGEHIWWDHFKAR